MPGSRGTRSERPSTTSAEQQARGHHSALRLAQSALSRDLVIGAADKLFREHGYVGTSIAAIARAAGVAIQTVYNAVGSKIDILSAVLDTHAQGPEAPRSVPDFLAERSGQAADVEALLDVLADWFVEVHERTAEVVAMIRQAAAVDPAAAELERTRAGRRRRNYLKAAAELRSRGAIPPGRSDTDVAAVIFALGHPEVYRALVLDGGWTAPQYRSWLRAGLAGAITGGIVTPG
jgi:AcrR family transcriptional regulator